MKNSFLFSIGTQSPIDLPPRPGTRREADPAALHVLGLLASQLGKQGFIATKPTFNKTGQACSSVSFADTKVHLILGVMRSEDRARFWLWTRGPSALPHSAVDRTTRDSKSVYEALNEALSREIGVQSLQWLTEREANALWNEYPEAPYDGETEG